MPTVGAPAGHVSRFRASGREGRSATVRGMDARDPSGLDLLAIGLATFFVALVLVVAALLVLPGLGG